MPLTLSTPLSLYSIPAVWVTAFYPATTRSRLINKIASYNNVAPRGNLARLAEKKADPELLARAARMDGAHLNGNENFPIWAIAVLVGNYAGVEPATLNMVSALYVFSRLLYNYIYFNQATRVQSGARTIVYFSGLALPMYLLIKSANLVRAGH